MPRALLVTGLLYGDEGKGSIVDYLTRETGAKLVVRHNGGSQAAHHVVAPDGRRHTFAQWGSGTFAGARTFLSKHMIVDPLALLNEGTHLAEIGVQSPFELLTIDERALAITPFHQMANRARELARGAGRHGSCGLGVGETYEDRDKPHALRFGELRDPAIVAEKLRATRADKGALIDAFDCDAAMMRALLRFSEAFLRVTTSRAQEEANVLRQASTVIFEGAQGVLLDQFRGVQPYTTWSNTTSENARAMLDGLGFEVTKVGVLRAYVTRHGAGPLATYDEALTAALQDSHNILNPWQGAFRCGWFDVPLARHALEIEGGVDQLAITNVDRLAPGTLPFPRLVCVRHDSDGPVYEAAGDVVEAIEEGLGTPVDIVSAGPTASDKTRRTRASKAA